MSSITRTTFNKGALTRLAQAVALAVSAALAGCQTTGHPDATMAASSSVLKQGQHVTRPTVWMSQSQANQPAEDVWERIRQGFQLQDGNGMNPRIEQQRLWFASNPSFIQNAGERGSPYMHYIVERLEERNMPLELALLPVIESAYNPLAYSRSDAVGIWQFVPATGRYYNLQQTRTYDARRDICASTQAALDYLTKLHDMFNGDWLLALAAYNAGEGTVSRAIERNQKLGLPTDYWDLPLPQETRDYVPKLLALSQVVLAPQAYGVNLSPIANHPYFGIVELNQRMDLARVAQMAQINENELAQLNPAYKQGLTLDGPQHLLVPTAKAELLAANLSNLKPEDLVNWQEYQVRAGDSLRSLASRYQVSASSLKSLNRLDTEKLHRGQILNIPLQPGMTPPPPVFENLATEDEPATSRKRRYTVKKGDTLASIARANKVDVKDLQHMNKLSGQHLKVGSTLVMQDTVKTSARGSEKIAKATAPNGKATRYKVQKGDTIYLVAKRFNVEMQHLKSWNPHNAQALKPGETLTVYLPR